MIAALSAWCARQGGMLVAPRRTVAALPADVGVRDGTWAVLAYLVAGRLADVIAAIARVVRLQTMDAGLVSLAEIGISLLPPVAATFGAEVLLGRGRSHRAGTVLAPLLVLAAIDTFVGAFAWRFEPTWLPDAIGVAAVLAFAAWARRAVPLETKDESVAASGSIPAHARVVGLVLAAALALAGTHELVRGVRSWSSAGPVAPGEAVPSFEVALLDGGTLANADLQGRVTVVTFWATWCGFCREELRELDEIDDGYADRPVRFVAVNHEGGGLAPRQAAALSRRYREHTQLGLPIAVDDGRMARSFRVGPIPHTVVLDRDGRIRHVHQGRVRAETIADEIDDLLAE